MRSLAVLMLSLCFLSTGCDEQISYRQRSNFLVTKQERRSDSHHRFKIPEDYYLDTTIYGAAIFDFSGHIVLPVGHDQVLNDLVRNDIIGQLDTFLAYIDTNFDQSLGNNFLVDVLSIYEDENIVSYSFMIQFYYSGSAHGMAQYYSYNYNRSTGKRIEFDDYFNVVTASDSAFLIREIKNHLWDTMVYLDALYNLDFCLHRDYVSFNFDDYEIGCYAQGVMQSPVRRSSLSRIVRPEYR